MAELRSRNSEVESVCPKYAEIVVIRHGETQWNVDRRIQGQLGVALNDLGRKQAFALAERLSREPKLNAVYTSDLKRALETAEIIAQSCGVLKICERHLGDLKGLLFVEADKLSQEDPRFRESSRNNDEGIPGGGESYDQLYNRCTSALQRIANQHIGERVAVVSHSVLGRASREGWKRIHQLVRPSTPMEHCIVE